MQPYRRTHPEFSLCGLNCGLCPRYHTEGTSKCPGCGGTGFHLQHPACAVITCSKKHGNPEFCFQCASYPCERYTKSDTADSFITYMNVKDDLQKAENNFDIYIDELREKMKFLEFLLKNYNDGKRKNYYCIAVNLLNMKTLRDLEDHINKKIAPLDADMKSKIKLIIDLFEDAAEENGIEIKLRK